MLFPVEYVVIGLLVEVSIMNQEPDVGQDKLQNFVNAY